ncbi:hypothetical protein ACFPOU_23765 [Massilia jejuensis]|uniref:Yip1 domain-containing protein n=1 Tax=Massilia jejuensis TaxID=648894 RepID=A0ABW0PNE6_9BURK
MSDENYNHGRVNGQTPYGLQSGSQAYMDAMRGVRENEDEQRRLDQIRQNYTSQPVHTSAPSGDPGFALGLIAIVVVVVAWILEYLLKVFGTAVAVVGWASRWGELEMPSMAVAFWYNYVLLVPLKGFSALWAMIVSRGLTDWLIVDVPLAIVAGYVYAVLLMAVWLIVKSWLEKAGIKYAKTVVFLLPGFALGLWYTLKIVW